MDSLQQVGGHLHDGLTRGKTKLTQGALIGNDVPLDHERASVRRVDGRTVVLFTISANLRELQEVLLVGRGSTTQEYSSK